MPSLPARSDLIPVGETAPDFAASLSDGTHITLSHLRGQRLVMVFYPGDNTPGCTAQLCGFRDNWDALQAQDTQVYGVNPAGSDKHAQFASKHHFPFPLIADAKGEIAAAFGCRALFGIIRRTVYIIDRQGSVAFAQRGNPDPAQILQVLKGLQDGAPNGG